MEGVVGPYTNQNTKKFFPPNFPLNGTTLTIFYPDIPGGLSDIGFTAVNYTDPDFIKKNPKFVVPCFAKLPPT
ncbi:hypothetical protein HK099_001652, partial [Clydaea vesicula]